MDHFGTRDFRSRIARPGLTIHASGTHRFYTCWTMIQARIGGRTGTHIRAPPLPPTCKWNGDAAFPSP